MSLLGPRAPLQRPGPASHPPSRPPLLIQAPFPPSNCSHHRRPRAGRGRGGVSITAARHHPHARPRHAHGTPTARLRHAYGTPTARLRHVHVTSAAEAAPPSSVADLPAPRPRPRRRRRQGQRPRRAAARGPAPCGRCGRRERGAAAGDMTEGRAALPAIGPHGAGEYGGGPRPRRAALAVNNQSIVNNRGSETFIQSSQPAWSALDRGMQHCNRGTRRKTLPGSELMSLSLRLRLSAQAYAGRETGSRRAGDMGCCRRQGRTLRPPPPGG